jgi:hypothetical protein
MSQVLLERARLAPRIVSRDRQRLTSHLKMGWWEKIRNGGGNEEKPFVLIQITHKAEKRNAID